jgi:murein DD-endopeptidase MepM/ murein hydrolase activator NlpD
LGLLEFNPYEGMSFTYEWGYLNQNKKKENRTQIVESNPGFVPGKYSGDKFIPCTPNGLFRERYPSKNTTNPYPHEGVDFDAAWGTDVFATIHGQVIYIGDQEDNHYGKHILISSEDGFIFLLGHLSKVEVSLYQNVAPKTIVAKVGNSGNCWTGGHKVTPSERDAKLGAHLHLSVYKATEREKIWSKRDTNYEKNQTLRNPFDRNHNFKTDGGL